MLMTKKDEKVYVSPEFYKRISEVQTSFTSFIKKHGIRSKVFEYLIELIHMDYLKKQLETIIPEKYPEL
jgi:hypothetical protein